MATVTRYVNTGSTAGGTGVTNATTGADRAYASMGEWEAAEQTDLVSDGDIHVLYCDGAGGDDTVTANINGWTTDATHYIDIKTTTANRHIGKPNTGYKLLKTGGTKALSINEACVRVTGVEMEAEASGLGLYGDASADADIRISYCLVYGTINNWTRNVTCSMASLTSAGKLRFWNSAVFNNVFGNERAAIRLDGTSGINFYFYNNTFYSCDRGPWKGSGPAASQCYFWNNISVGHNSVTCYQDISVNSDYNLSDSTISTGGANDIKSATITFADAANWDLHLVVSDTDAIGAGTDLSADSIIPISDDVDGDTRSSWDVGFDEYIAGGADTALTSSVTANASTSSDLTTSINLVGNVNAQATVAADLTTGIPLAASVNAQASIAADLTTGIDLVASVNARASVAADLTTAIPLAASVTASATVSADLEVGATTALAASVSASASVAADLTTGISLGASVNAQASIAAQLTTGISLVSSVSAQATVAAELTTSIDLSSAVVASCGTFADLTTGISLVSSVSAQATTLADLFTGNGVGRVTNPRIDILTAQRRMESLTPARLMNSLMPSRRIRLQ